jgi:Tfp pilus assembly pilus retraction ATPase PilT
MVRNPTLVKNKVRGDLEALPLLEVCQFLLIGGKTGTLRVESGTRRATLTLVEGQIAAAREETGLEGAEAASEALSWVEGAFEFTPGAVAMTEGGRVEIETETLLLDAARCLDGEGAGPGGARGAGDPRGASGGDDAGGAGLGADPRGAGGARAAAFLEKQRLASEMADLFGSIDAGGEGHADEIDFREEVPLDALLALADRHGASQIHLRAGETPKARGPRGFVALARSPVTRGAVERILVEFLGSAEKVLFDLRERISRESLIEGIGYVHLDASREEDLRRVVITRLESEAPPLAAFGLAEEAVAPLLRAESGLVLIASPPRGGKSALAAALAAAAGRGAGRHIVFFEESRRYRLREESGVLDQRDLVLGLTRRDEILAEVWGAKAEVLVLDAVRSAEHARAAVEAAEAGALVVAAVDTPGPAEAIVRFSRLVGAVGRRGFLHRIAARFLASIAVRPSEPDAPGAARAPRPAAWEAGTLAWSPALARALRADDPAALAACIEGPRAARP